MQKLGGGIAAAGAGMAVVGVAVAAGLEKAVKFGNEFDTAARLTLTQTKGVTDSLQDVKNVALEVAKTVPVPLEELQPALYDIFSSMDVNINQAKDVLAGFSKAAVAGGTDVQTAGRATIAILNGFHIPVSKLNDVLDVQFQLVAKGVGTYEEFAKGIGRAIPAANKAGQSVQELAGGLAFLTRSGLSVPMAATSMSRAFDMLTNTKAIKGLQDIGISVFDAQGKTRKLSDIVIDLSAHLQDIPPDKLAKALDVGKDFGTKLDQVKQLQAHFKDMTSEERVKAMNDIFGTGSGYTQQAQRFWSLALANTAEYKQRVDDMTNAHGTLDRAFGIMSGGWKAKWEGVKNSVKTLAIEIRDDLMPYVERVMDAFNGLVNWFEKLDPSTKKAIVKFTAIAAIIGIVGGALLIAVGALTSFVGTILASSGAVEALTGAIGILTTPIGAVLIPALLLIGPVIAAIIDHWDEFYRKVKNIITEIGFIVRMVFDDIKDYIQRTGLDKKAAEMFQKAKDAIWPILSRILDQVKGFLDGVVDFWRAHGQTILNVIGPFIATIIDIFSGFFDLLGGNWSGLFRDIENGWEDMTKMVNGIANAFIQALLDIFFAFADKAVGIFDAVFGFLPHFHEAMDDARTKLAQAKKDVDDFFNKADGTATPKLDTQPMYAQFDSIVRTYDSVKSHIEHNTPVIGTGIVVPRGMIGANAEGGFINRPEISWVGEKGRELILPLNNRARTMELLGQAGLRGQMTTGGGGTTITIEKGAIQVTGQSDPEMTANLTVDKIMAAIRQRQV